MDCFWMLVRFWCAFVCQESFKALCVRKGWQHLLFSTVCFAETKTASIRLQAPMSLFFPKFLGCDDDTIRYATANPGDNEDPFDETYLAATRTKQEEVCWFCSKKRTVCWVLSLVFSVPMWYWKSIELWNRFARSWKSIELAKVYMKYWKSMEIPNSAISSFKFLSLPRTTVLQMFFCVVFHE